MEDIDIFQRTLKCQDAQKKEEEAEIEIFEIESQEPSIEEETVVEEHEDIIDPEIFYDELECLKRRILRLLVILKADTEPCIKKPCDEVTTTCCERLEICNLQKQQHDMQQQINELLRAFNAIKEEIHDLYIYFCKQSKDIEQLKNLKAFLEYWQNGLKPDDGVCHQRYVYIREKKSDWTKIQTFLQKEKRCPVKISKEYVLKSIYETNNIVLQAELEKYKALYVEIFEMNRGNLDDSICSVDSMSNIPLKRVEIDFIDRQIALNRKLENPSCAIRLKCDKIDF